MRGTGRFQRFLYLIMFVLGLYILYKAGSILLENTAVQQALESGEVQRNLEDAAMRTYAPGYTGTVEGQDMPDWLAIWMRQVAPVYSYLAEGQAGETEGVAQGEAAARNAGSEEAQVQQTEVSSDSAADLQEAFGTTGRSEAEQTKTAGSESGGTEDEALQTVSGSVVSEQLLEQLKDFDYLLSHYYTVDEGTMADEQLLDAEVLLQKDLRLACDPSVPQILIYHTHSQEAFADSEEGKVEDTIIGMGELLAEELRNTYGYHVIHDVGVYDLVDGVMDRSAAYDYAREAVEQLLQENPTIEVIIDLHRDGVEGEKFATEIDGKPASRIMFFNGISRDSADQPLSWLENPYIQDNLAFSLQLQLAAEELFPGFTRNIYLKAERFNLHLRPRSLLIEAGTQLNTVEEERNAMRPLADLLHRVLSGAEESVGTDIKDGAGRDENEDS